MSDQKPGLTSAALFKQMTREPNKQFEVPMMVADSVNYEPQIISGVQVELSPAPIGRRLLAFMIDLGIVSAVSYAAIIPVVMVAGILGITASAMSRTAAGVLLVILALVFLLAMLIGMHWFFIHYERKKGATPGKRLMGLRVVSTTTGGPITFRQALMRELIRWYIDGILGIPALIAVLVTKRRQRVGDLMANTLVIYSASSANEDKFQYVLQNDYKSLLSALGAPTITAEGASSFLTFSNRVILRKEKADQTSMDEAMTWCHHHVPRARELGLNDETLLRYVAEYCYQMNQNKRQKI